MADDPTQTRALPSAIQIQPCSIECSPISQHPPDEWPPFLRIAQSLPHGILQLFPLLLTAQVPAHRLVVGLASEPACSFWRKFASNPTSSLQSCCCFRSYPRTPRARLLCPLQISHAPLPSFRDPNGPFCISTTPSNPPSHATNASVGLVDTTPAHHPPFTLVDLLSALGW